ncbi:MAG: beta-Ala-His dipeptidase, partial [Candidatus Thorarchaeota archaeon]
MSKLVDLGQPYEFWEYFEQIAKIPRCSGNEEKVRTYIVKEAERLGFVTRVDKTGNLTVKIPANEKQKHKVVLQCHLDMVCEKNQGVIHDFSKDPIKLSRVEIENERWITADGTTLGADNAVGICYLLTMMNKIHKSELDFGSLGIDLLFTIDEEIGLRGAFNIDEDLIEGTFLINLDAEDEDAVTIGCAGGRVSFFQIKNEPIEVNKNQDLIPIKIFVSGLLGGHSGADIHLGRGNALKILGEILWKLNKKYFINLNSINGGNRTNAIPREASAIMYIKELNFSELKNFIQDLMLKIERVYEHIEPTLQVLVERINYFTKEKIFKKRLQDKVLDILYTLPNGPISMHPQIKGLVFTSSNLAVVTTGKEIIEIKISQRSLSRYFKITLWEKTISLFELTGLNAEVKIDSDYP